MNADDKNPPFGNQGGGPSGEDRNPPFGNRPCDISIPHLGKMMAARGTPSDAPTV